MKLYGLIGQTLQHSFSQQYFSEKFADLGLNDHRYDLIEFCDSDQLAMWMNGQAAKYKGLNVTIPYKQSIIEHLESLSEEANLIGAVNTIANINGLKMGYNTDVYGFENSLMNLGWISKVSSALILGTGGASKAVEFVLSKHKIKYSFVSRTPCHGQLAYGQLKEHGLSSFDLIVNTTPLGTYPDVNGYPDIPYDTLKAGTCLYDLIYNPSKTVFLERGEQKGCLISNGLSMLEGQAEKAWEIWTNDEKSKGPG